MAYLLDPTWMAAFSLLLLCIGVAYVAVSAEPPA
jgi:hypothetical protein